MVLLQINNMKAAVCNFNIGGYFKLPTGIIHFESGNDLVLTFILEKAKKAFGKILTCGTWCKIFPN